MSRKRSNSEPPETMTWPRAIPIIVVAIILDLLRALFEMLWFFGPAIAALACTGLVNGALGTSIAATAGKVVAASCTSAAAVAGFFGIETTETIGVIMADAVGFVGFLILLFWIVKANPRLLKVGATSWLSGGLGISVIPFIGTFPIFSVLLFKLYQRQIQVETATLKSWEQERAAEQIQEREQRAMQLMQLHEAQLAQIETQEAANADSYSETEQDEEIHGEMLRAA